MKPHDHYGSTVKNIGVSDAPLGAQSPSRQSPVERKRDRDRLKERLLPVVLELARRRGGEGITASEVLAEALVLGIVTPAPATDPRRHAWIGPWLAVLAKGGQLAPKTVRLPDGGTLHVTRKSQRHGSHANKNDVYLHPAVAA
jgi:hypothetical protein